jgi:hypothetical protein
MANVASKQDDVGTLYRWECSQCPKKGVWVRDREQAERGADLHTLRWHA